MEVSRFVEYYFKDDSHLDELKAVAYLHDTLEDTNTTFEEIAYNFNYNVASLVLELTNDQMQKKTLTKKIYLSCKMANMSSYALTIKLLDRLSNVKDLIHADEKFRNRYLKETYYILSHFKKMRRVNKMQEQIINTIYSEMHLYENINNKENTKILSLAS